MALSRHKVYIGSLTRKALLFNQLDNYNHFGGKWLLSKQKIDFYIKILIWGGPRCQWCRTLNSSLHMSKIRYTCICVAITPVSQPRAKWTASNNKQEEQTRKNVGSVTMVTKTMAFLTVLHVLNIYFSSLLRHYRSPWQQLPINNVSHCNHWLSWSLYA